MKFRYLVFGYFMFYPEGGMKDCVFKTNKTREIRDFVNQNEKKYDFYDIYDVFENRTFTIDKVDAEYLCPRCGKNHLTSPMDICNLCKWEVKLLNAIFNSREED